MFQLDKIIKLLLIFLLGVISFSCKPLYTLKNGVNKSVEFNSKEEYLLKISKKYAIDTTNIVFLDSINKYEFINYIIDEKVAYIYGIVVNKKQKIDNNFIEENNSCYSRVTNLIMKNPDLIDEKFVPTKILNFNFVNSKNTPIRLEGDKILLFIFSTKLGSSIINDIKNITEEFNSNEIYKSYNYYLISID
jgi:hypothetical protein